MRIKDKDTDYKLNWIENSMNYVCDALDEGFTEAHIIKQLEIHFKIEEQMISLILSGGKMLHQDLINDYKGD